jgi:sec-independent protein translocase protein TatC
LLFAGGGIFGMRVAFPITFNYFLGLAGEAKDNADIVIHPVVMMDKYLDFVTQMLLAFGIIFELPLFILFLSIAGLVNYLQLIRFGRWFVLIAFVVAAVVTPPDMGSQIAMAIPLCVLYLVSIGLAYAFGKRPSPEEIARDRAAREARKAARTREREAKREAQKREMATKRLAAKNEPTAPSPDPVLTKVDDDDQAKTKETEKER